MRLTTFKDGNGNTFTASINDLGGRQAAADSKSVSLSSEDFVALTGIATKLAGSLTVTGTFFQATQPVSGTLTVNAGTGTFAMSAATLPLPTGAASSANQNTLNSVIGTPTDTAWSSGNATQIGLLKAIATNANSTAPSSVVGPGKWETVAASASAQSLGATGATGDFISHLLIIPATTSPGAVSIQDGAGSAITVFTGGASSVSNLAPFAVPLGMTSLTGAWKVTTGANVSAIGVGLFT